MPSNETHEGRSEDTIPPRGELRPEKEKRARQHTAVNAVVIHEAIRRDGAEQLRRSSAGLAFSGLAAGLSMGFSMVTEGLLHTSLPDAAWSPLISNFGYTVGFLIVVLGRQHLFTEDTLTVVLPLLGQRDRTTLMNVLRLWGVVLVTNLFGALLSAWTVGNTAVPRVQQSFAELGREAVGAGFGTVLLRGIFAGWLIALMVWLLPFADVARVFVIIIITYVVGLGGSRTSSPDPSRCFTSSPRARHLGGHTSRASWSPRSWGTSWAAW